jgi:hypothetical protein
LRRRSARFNLGAHLLDLLCLLFELRSDRCFKFANLIRGQLFFRHQRKEIA